MAIESVTEFPADLPFGRERPIRIGDFVGMVKRVRRFPHNAEPLQPTRVGGLLGRYAAMIGASEVVLIQPPQHFPCHLQITWEGEPRVYAIRQVSDQNGRR